MTALVNNSTSLFRLSPLIRITLLSLYIALTIPLPFLAKVTAAPVPPIWLWIGISGTLKLSKPKDSLTWLCERQIR
ncbi:hypothetical protein C7B79_25230 [Chroococcidiopsis cubana CCALA 043]|nr:hypothetical protein C7B79_25230 [Chroococcidiopsis cubana CCALA 043]